MNHEVRLQRSPNHNLTGKSFSEALIFASTKAELLQEGIFFLIYLFARDVFVMKKLEIEKTKLTFNYISFKS